jgi:hypothetical protein
MNNCLCEECGQEVKKKKYETVYRVVDYLADCHFAASTRKETEDYIQELSIEEVRVEI